MMQIKHFYGMMYFTIRSILIGVTIQKKIIINHALIKENAMGTSYKKIWKLLIDRDLKKKDLCEISSCKFGFID